MLDTPELYAYALINGERRLCQIIAQRSANVFEICLFNASGQPGKIVAINRQDLSPVDLPNVREILGLRPLPAAALGTTAIPGCQPSPGTTDIPGCRPSTIDNR